MANVVIPYAPRKAFLAFHARTKRWATLICHRRAGKTVCSINDLIRRAALCTLPQPRFAYMAPTRVRGKDIAWQYLKRFSQPIPGVKVIESELAIEMPGSGARVTIYGADNERAMGLYLDGIVFDECDEIAPKVWDTVRPALSDRKGWAVWMGILKGRHNLFKRYEENKNDPEWFSMLVRASESGILPAEELASMQKQMGEVAYDLQMECDVSKSVANAIYGLHMDKMRKENRIANFNYDKTCPLFTFWDIGQSDFTAIWLVQFVGRDICVLDFFSRNGQPPAFYAAKIAEWGATYEQTIKVNYLPHDADTRGPSGKTYVTYLREAGLQSIKVVPRTPDLWLGINELRALLDRTFIHQKNCSATWTLGEVEMPTGIDCLDYYRKKEAVTSGVILDQPVHDQYSHGADALRTMAEAYRQGMIEGTSFARLTSSNHDVKVLRGASKQTYSMGRRPVALR